MNTGYIIKSNERLNNSWKAAGKASEHLTTRKGTQAVITKFWNNGFNKAAAELGFGKPSELCKAVEEGIDKHLFHDELFGNDAKGNECIGVYKLKKLEDKTVEPIIDAKGKETYPYLKDAEGNIVVEDVWQPITRWSPKLMFELLIQEEWLRMQDSVRDVIAENGLNDELVDALTDAAITKQRQSNVAEVEARKTVKAEAQAKAKEPKVEDPKVEEPNADAKAEKPKAKAKSRRKAA